MQLCLKSYSYFLCLVMDLLNVDLPVGHGSMANSQHAEDNPKHVKMPREVSVSCSELQPKPFPAAPDRAAEAVGSVPSFSAASELLSAPYSCLVMSTHRRHLALPPMFLNKKRTGIQEELDAELLKFSESLRGVPLAYDNMHIVGLQGDIYDDSGYIHMNIEANFIVFQPKKGQKILGKVNKLGVNHVGCLVHGCFNASIPKPNLVAMETWRDAGPQIGSDLEFEVTALDADTAGVLLIRGRLKRTRVQELLAIGERSEPTVPVQQPEEPDVELTPEPVLVPPEETPKKKKKKKKDKVKEEQEEPLTAPFTPELDTTLELNGTMNETNGNVEKKKKKKKKDKQVKEEPAEVELSIMEVHVSESSGYLSKKLSKKRKHQTEIASGYSEESETPKSKKKRKTLIEPKEEID